MTCGCSGGPCWKADLIAAVSTQAQAEGTTAAWYRANDLMYRMTAAAWNTAHGSLAPAFVGQLPGLGWSATRLQCHLDAMIDLYNALVLCGTNQSCIDEAKATYQAAAAACDAA